MLDTINLVVSLVLVVLIVVDLVYTRRTYRETIDPETDAELGRFITTVHVTSDKLDAVRISQADMSHRVRYIESQVGWISTQLDRRTDAGEQQTDPSGEASR